MQIVDLTPENESTYFVCLEDWSAEMTEAGNHKEHWYRRMKGRGLRVKVAIADGNVCGMIQYLPAEQSFIYGRDLYFILCIWVHGYKEGIGKYQKRGIGKALLHAAEADVRDLAKGIAAWGISLPFWMRASWFVKQGYRKVDKNGQAVLLWKPFDASAVEPRWIRQQQKPGKGSDVVKVSAFMNGWCPALNMVYERARRAAAELGEAVEFEGINTADRQRFLEWGISDGVFIDGKQMRSGPPPAYEKIKKRISRRVRRLNR